MRCTSCGIEEKNLYEIVSERGAHYICKLCLVVSMNRLKKIKEPAFEEKALLQQLNRAIGDSSFHE